MARQDYRNYNDSSEHDETGVIGIPVKKVGNYIWNGSDWERWTGDIDVTNDEWAINDIEDASATVTYVGKENSEGVYVINKIDTTSGYAVTYATIVNNPTRTTYDLAWTNRATLTYNKFATAI